MCIIILYQVYHVPRRHMIYRFIFMIQMHDMIYDDITRLLENIITGHGHVYAQCAMSSLIRKYKLV